jgi:pimeloyl-ACP methyl ester carboxylesterase
MNGDVNGYMTEDRIKDDSRRSVDRDPRGSLTRSMLSLSVSLTFLLFTGCRAYTEPYRNPEWKRNGITSLETVELGGIPHSVLIRGTDLNNPILVVLHGFAAPMMPIAHLQYAGEGDPFEEKFVIVHYDQRGIGKTAALSDPDESTFTIEQYVSDAEELISKLRTRFKRERVFLSGISWGSVIGMKLIRRHPEWFYAYVAEGQTANMAESYADIKRMLVNDAKEEGHQNALKEIESVMLPHPSLSREENVKSTETLGRWMDYYMVRKYKLLELSRLYIKSLFAAPEYSLSDCIATLQSMEKFINYNTQSLLAVDMLKEVPEVNVPVYMITGEYDPMKYAGKRYFDLLRAPEKTWFEIQRAGHAASADQPAQVQGIYIDLVRKRHFH